MDASGKINVIIDHNNQIVGHQHIDNGGIKYKLDPEFSMLTISSSFFGYGESQIQVPYFNIDEMINFLNVCKQKMENDVVYSQK